MRGIRVPILLRQIHGVIIQHGEEVEEHNAQSSQGNLQTWESVARRGANADTYRVWSNREWP